MTEPGAGDRWLRNAARKVGRCCRYVWVHRPENFYRDIWLLIISIVLWQSLVAFQAEQNRAKVQRDNLETLGVQLCKVVVNVHNAQVADVQAKQDQLTQTLNYLATLTPEERINQAGLITRIRANLPTTRKAVENARKQEFATRPPAACASVRRN